jgi:hypothetical protein
MSIFTKVQNQKVGSNTFDLSHDRKMSMDMGLLTPIHCQEIVPGDKINMSTSQMLRMAPMITPVMHQVKVYTHFFFVPNRLLWLQWEQFITGGEDGLDTSVFPYVTARSNMVTGSLSDYFSVPVATPVSHDMQISALPFYAYNRIYNEYYRDQNLVEPLGDTAIDGNNSNVFVSGGTQLQNWIALPPQRRAWQHDYFTSALPWTQKGPEATIPLGSTAPINFIPDAERYPGAGSGTSMYNESTDTYANDELLSSGFTNNARIKNSLSQTLSIDNSYSLETDLSLATASSINDLRRAFKLQEWLEKNARGGSRYIESILSHFGVRSSDARLQRPEFLGGGSTPMVISEVLQTSDAAAGETPQGNMAGHGISVGANNSFSYYAEEHGYIIGIMSIMPKPAYQQGIPKHFLKFDKFDYYWPSFAHIGEQPIQNKELYIEGDSTDEDTFGYTPRYAEYKFINSSVHGEFRTTLDFWHMGRIFATQPALNKTFIECDPTDRIFAVLESEKIYCHIFHRIKATRKMPYFGTPRM